VVNACLDEARSRKPRAAAYERLRLEATAAAGSQESGYAQEQAAQSVRAAVASLPATFRIAVLLRYFDDLSYEEMAIALRCSMGTVASRLNRGHRMLAERLKGVVE
jgi:RNA polymerase sigma-70 factor (ECF subfamily)